MIGIKQSPSCFAALGGRYVCLWSVLALAAAACGDKPAPPETDTLVRPATSAPAKVEDKPEPPLPAEGSDIPKGVSAPELSAEEAHAQAQPGEGEAAPDSPDSIKPPSAKTASAKAAKADGSQSVKPKAARPQAEPKPASSTKIASAHLPAKAKVERAQPAASAATRAPATPQPSAASAAPVAPAPEPQPVAAAKRVSVQVPSTDHVRVDVPAGLQGWLDADDRMRPWLGKAIAVADSCYAKVRADNPSATGEIAVQLTMHENARPSGRVASASAAVSGITMCATTRLLGVKMPLFTGREGETYTVRVKFSP